MPEWQPQLFSGEPELGQARLSHSTFTSLCPLLTVSPHLIPDSSLTDGKSRELLFLEKQYLLGLRQAPWKPEFRDLGVSQLCPQPTLSMPCVCVCVCVCVFYLAAVCGI